MRRVCERELRERRCTSVVRLYCASRSHVSCPAQGAADHRRGAGQGRRPTARKSRYHHSTLLSPSYAKCSLARRFLNETTTLRRLVQVTCVASNANLCMRDFRNGSDACNASRVFACNACHPSSVDTSERCWVWRCTCAPQALHSRSRPPSRARVLHEPRLPTARARRHERRWGGEAHRIEAAPGSAG